MGLELMAGSMMAGTHPKNRRDRVPNLGAATLKLREPNEVRMNGAHNKLVFESLSQTALNKTSKSFDTSMKMMTLMII